MQADAYADAVIDVLDALGLERAFVAGCMWGGQVAAHVGVRAPVRVRAFTSAFASFDPAAAAVTARTVLTRFPGLAAVLPRLSVPTTILMGAEDRLYPVERMRSFAALAPGANLTIVPACGHLAPVEAPEAVVATREALAGRAP